MIIYIYTSPHDVDLMPTSPQDGRAWHLSLELLCGMRRGRCAADLKAFSAAAAAQESWRRALRLAPDVVPTPQFGAPKEIKQDHADRTESCTKSNVFKYNNIFI